MKALFGCAVVLALAAPAAAQATTDARWQPWLGCWQMLDGRAGAADASVCVAPGAEASAVTLTTRAGNEPAFEQTLVANGAAQALEQGECKGTQRLEWSATGQRLFTRAELACPGQPARTISGIATIALDGTWVDVQAMTSGAGTSVRTRRYARRDGPRRAGTQWTLDEVKEASRQVTPMALEAALIESDARFRLNGGALVELDEANVPDSVVDVMVALSYPEQFQIDRRGEVSVDRSGPIASASGYSALGLGWDDPLLYGIGFPYFAWYPGYYGSYRYYYSPFGYGYRPYDIYPGGVIGGGGSVAPGEPVDRSDGRVVNGVGYTRVRPREAQAGSGANAGSSATTSSGSNGTRSRGESNRGRATSGGYSADGGGSTSSGGSSSGGGGNGGNNGGRTSSGGRTAQPR